MRVLILGDADSSHTSKWINSLTEKGIVVRAFSLSSFDSNEYLSASDIKVLDFSTYVKKKRDGSWIKIIYLSALKRIKKLIHEFQPDILHSHSASSYGFLGTLSGFHPHIISAWGSDIYIFPRKSIVHKEILKYSLKRADQIISTSKAMANEILLYTKKRIEIINFGVNTNVFKPHNKLRINDEIVIGTIKRMDYNYGIEYLIKAFAILIQKYPNLKIKLLLIGGGGMEKELRALALSLGINEKVTFWGHIPHSQIHSYYEFFDFLVFPSVSESFGVSVLEASSCQKAVIASAIGGLPEVVLDKQTGLLFSVGNISELVEKIEQLLFNTDARNEMGIRGRKFVKENYEWNKNVLEMISSYKRLISN